MKKHNISIKRYFDKEIGSPVMSIEVTQELANLIATYAVRDRKKNTQYIKSIELEDDANHIEYLQRFLINQAFFTSVCGNYGGWLNIFDLFFTEELLSDLKLVIPLTSVQSFNEFERRTSNLKEFISIAEQLQTSKTVNIEFTVEVQ